MKRTARSTIALFAVLVFTFTLTVSAGAEGALYTILATGTTQSFAADAVPDEDIRTILEAGASTASAINQQPWFFVAITDQDLMKEIGGGVPGGFPAGNHCLYESEFQVSLTGIRLRAGNPEHGDRGFRAGVRRQDCLFPNDEPERRKA